MRCDPFATHSFGPYHRTWDERRRGVVLVKACEHCGKRRWARTRGQGSTVWVDRGRYISPLRINVRN